MRDKWVASGRRNSGNGLKVVRASSQGWKSGYSRGEGGRLSRNLEHTLRTWIRSMDAEHCFSLSLARSNIRHDFFLDSPSWQTTRSRVLAHDNFILTRFLIWCVDTKVGLKVSTRRLCNRIIVSPFSLITDHFCVLKKNHRISRHVISFHIIFETNINCSMTLERIVNGISPETSHYYVYKSKDKIFLLVKSQIEI